LLEQIERSDSAGKTSIWSLSGAGFVIRSGGYVIYVDSWLVPPDPARTTHRTFPIPFAPDLVTKATAILATHEHEDHCNVATLVGLSKNTSAPLYAPVSAASKAESGGFPKSKIKTVSPGDIVRISDQIKLEIFEGMDPYEEKAVMFLITTPTGNIFHSGDSAYFGGFKEIGDNQEVDVALLNFGMQIPDSDKPYYMNSEKFSLAARDLRARIAVPMHWNLWLETREDPRQIIPVLRSVSPGTRLQIIEAGEKFDL
jgi:L-ascorbate 6-phosphate lactonase